MKLNLQNPVVGGFDFEFYRAAGYGTTSGSELNECVATANRIKANDMESWIVEWLRTADRVAASAERSLQQRDLVSARGAFHRASNYYRAAEFYATCRDPRQEQAWRCSRECFQQAAALTTPAIETIEIPFEGARLPGYLVHGGSGKRPTLLAMSGFDGSAEELYHFIGAAAAERGWHCLIFEGPGQRGALHLNPGLTFRPDYEVPVRAVVDYALSRPEIDGDRLALIGYSFGGYLAPRAAAFEPRIKAVIANSLLVDLYQAWGASWPAFVRSSPPAIIDLLMRILLPRNADLRWAFEHGQWAFGLQRPHEYFSVWKPYTLWGTEARLQAPMLFIAGEDEIGNVNKAMIQATFRYLDALNTTVDFRLFSAEAGGSIHCQIGGMSGAQTAIFEWLEQTLCRKPATPPAAGSRRIRMSPEFIFAVQKHYGAEAAKPFMKFLEAG